MHQAQGLRQRRSAVILVCLMMFSTISVLHIGSMRAAASLDADGDGLAYGLEFYINTQPQTGTATMMACRTDGNGSTA